MCEMCEMFIGAAVHTAAPSDAPTSADIVRHEIDRVCYCYECDNARLLAQSKIDGVQLVLPPEFLPIPRGQLFA